jgi:hypothetical protein
VSIVRVDIEDFERKVKQDMLAREKRIEAAIALTAKLGAAYVKTRVPVAFEDLRKSVHATESSIIADAPHAAPVETGSRPHWMPIKPLLRWVELRFAGKTPSELKSIAYAIQHKIAERGTRPTWYMLGAVPEVEKILDREVRRALPDP